MCSQAFPAPGSDAPPDSEGKSIKALLAPYRDPVALRGRPFHDAAVADTAVALARIVEYHAPGYGQWAIVIAQLLRASEPLEQLTVDDLPYYQMRLLGFCYLKRLKDAFDELNCGLAHFPEELFFGQVLFWLCQLAHQGPPAGVGLSFARSQSARKEGKDTASQPDSPGSGSPCDEEDPGGDGDGEQTAALQAHGSPYHAYLFPLSQQRAVLASVGNQLARHIQHLRAMPDPPSLVLDSVALLLIMEVLLGLGQAVFEQAQQTGDGQPFLCALKRVSLYLRVLLASEQTGGSDASREANASRDILYLVIQVTCPYLLSSTWQRPVREH